MIYSEDELLPISALQHLAFCPRQWALIHLEGIWSDNRLTAEGIIMHDKAHDENSLESRGDVRIARGLRLRSLRLGLVGQADVVEFHKTTDSGIQFAGSNCFWQPIIIEYKHGHPKIGHEDEVQLCAQALCLEEMLGASLSVSSFFYGQPRRRSDLSLTAELRQETEQLISRLHELSFSGETPAADFSSRCHSCSLENTCLPKITKGGKSVKDYIQQNILPSEEIP
jgi:CRISPR-associated exonuclease Cas4